MTTTTLGMTAVEVKEVGNDLYKNYHFDKADAAYTQALKESQEPHLRATLFSNRANCRMERGDYGGAMEDSRAALQVLQTSSPENKESMQSKNQWRLARALFYSGNGSAAALKTLLEDITDDELKGKIELLLRASQSKTMSVQESVDFIPQLLRSNFLFPYVEYYPFGHDYMETAFSLGDELLALKDVGDEFHVLYGGAGDGRHMLATILHAHRMWVDDDEPDFTLRCTMNDINAQVLAKDILVLVVTHRIGKLAQEYDLMHEEREPYLLAVVLYYATLGHAMPAVVYDKLQSLVQELFLDQDYKSFREAYPWIYVTESDWETFVRVFSHWADTSMYEPPLPSVKKVLATHVPETKLPSFEAISGNYGMADMEGTTERFRQREEETQARLEAAKADIADIDNWRPNFAR